MNLGSHLLQKLHGAEVVILEKFQKPSESKFSIAFNKNQNIINNLDSSFDFKTKKNQM